MLCKSVTGIHQTGIHQMTTTAWNKSDDRQIFRMTIENLPRYQGEICELEKSLKHIGCNRLDVGTYFRKFALLGTRTQFGHEDV